MFYFPVCLLEVPGWREGAFGAALLTPPSAVGLNIFLGS